MLHGVGDRGKETLSCSCELRDFSPQLRLSHHAPGRLFARARAATGAAAPPGTPCAPPAACASPTPHMIGAWLGSAHLRRETAPPCGSCGRCLGGYPWAARAGGVLRVGCAASPTAVLAADGDGDVHNTWGARTPRRVASRGCLSPGFLPTPPNSFFPPAFSRPHAPPRSHLGPSQPPNSPHPTPRSISPVLAPFCPCPRSASPAPSRSAPLQPCTPAPALAPLLCPRPPPPPSLSAPRSPLPPPTVRSVRPL